MRTYTLAMLSKAIYRLASICTLLLPSAAFPYDSISSKKSLETTLEKAVMCDVDALATLGGGEFDGGPNDPRPRLENLGVKIVDETGQDEAGRVTYRLPRGINVFGYEAREALFFAESTTIFFITLRSDSGRLKEISKTLGLTPVPKGSPEGYGYFDEFNVQYIRKLSTMGDTPPDTIFSGTGNRQNYVVIGCQNLAW